MTTFTADQKVTLNNEAEDKFADVTTVGTNTGTEEAPGIS